MTCRRLHRLEGALVLLVVLLTAGCPREPERAAPPSWPFKAATCDATFVLGAPAASLTEIPIAIQGGDCVKEWSAVTVDLDMPDMPMGVAPVTLVRDDGRWTGVIVFTMGGRWRIGVTAEDARGRSLREEYEVVLP